MKEVLTSIGIVIVCLVIFIMFIFGISVLEMQRTDMVYHEENITIETGYELLYQVKFWGVIPDHNIIKIRRWYTITDSELEVYPIVDSSFIYERFGTEKLVLTNIVINTEDSITCNLVRYLGKYAREN